MVESNRNRVSRTKYDNMKELFNFFNIEYTTGNDAPRGGAAGDYINLTPKALDALVLISNKLKA